MSRPQIDAIISRSVSLLAVLLAVQATQAMTQQSAQLSPLWSIVVTLMIYCGLIAVVITASLNRGSRFACGYFTVAWLIGTASWPLAVGHATFAVPERPWLWYFCCVATATAAVAWPRWPALAAVVIAPLCFGLVRVSPAGGGAPFSAAALDVVGAWLLGVAILGLITMLRQTATAVDLAQSAALKRYARAVRRHATEVQRSQVDGMVHDSVLSTLLAASRADSLPSRRLAVEMAVDAIGFLRDAAVSVPGDDQVVSLRGLVKRIERASRSLSVVFDFESEELPDDKLSTPVAEAIFSAALQAMSNSVEHARDALPPRRWVSIRGRGHGRIVVEVGDTGQGFDPQHVSALRIGLRVSIVERMLNAGGRADIRSTRGVGTVISLVWPDDRRGNRPLSEPGHLGAGAGFDESARPASTPPRQTAAS